MGYRSEVAIAIHTKNYNTMIRRAANLKDPNIYEFIASADRYVINDVYKTNIKKSKVTILTWDWVKWYPEFKEVAWVENFIKKIDAVFIRLGEDMDDNEQRCYGDDYELQDYIYIDRRIGIVEGVKKE